MSKIGIALKIVAIACFALLLSVGCTSAATLVVSKTSPACTSGDDYYRSIQAAVDNAKEGDEIVVCSGTYKENIEVDKPLSICSYAGAADTIMEAKNISKNIISVTANNVNISDFIIRNTEANGIYLDAVVGCNLSGNNIYSTQNGIRLFLSDLNQIYHNTANLNNNSGIFLESSNINLIVNNTANSNKQYEGIELLSSNNNSIIANNASNNMQDGIRLEGSDDNILRGNTANSNKQYHGIELISSNNNSIIANNASNNYYQGINLISSDHCTIFNNTLKSNGNNGIYLHDSDYNTIKNNKATNSRNYSGISVYSNSNHNIIMGNNASNNFYSGIALFELSNNNTIRGNIANSNKQYHGIELNTSNNNSIFDNNASYNFQLGIALISSNNNIIRGNNANSNKQYHGIGLDSSLRNIIMDNSAIANKGDGFDLVSSSYNIIKNNTLESNILVGIRLEELSTNNVLEQNRAFDCVIGIYLESSSNNIIKNNNLKSINGNIVLGKSSNNNILEKNMASDSFYGIRVENSSSNIIKGNIITSNDLNIALDASNSNIIKRNIILNSDYGIELLSSVYNSIDTNILKLNGLGFNIIDSNNNTIEKNIVSDGFNGFEIEHSDDNFINNNIIRLNKHAGSVLSVYSKNNLLTSNNISLNCYGLIFEISTENILYHNIIDNNDQVFIKDNESVNNNWYHPDLLEGNYWSDYNGTDTDGDGIGDTDTPHPEEGYDLYPFINKSGWLTFLVSPGYCDFGTVYQGEIVQKTFKIQNAFVYNKGRDDLNILSITSEPDVDISGIELPMKIPKGSSKVFNVTIDTTNLEGNIMRSIEISSDDKITPNKTILIYGIVKPPIHDVRIKNIDFQSRIIKGQISLFNITVENLGDFREKNLTVEIKEGERILDSTTIGHIDCKEYKPVIVKWETGNAALGFHDITIVVLDEDKESLTDLTAKVSVLAPSKAKSLIVTNLERLDEVENDLIRLSHHPSVNGIILNVATDQKCAEAYNSWDSNPTSENANDVARAIKKLIDSSLKVYENTEYIIIAGNDEVIPFYRIQDKSLESYVGSYGLYDEKDYIERYEQLKSTTAIGSAFQDNMFLTDDFYADFESEDLPEGFLGELYIPDKPIGRLVETPEEISKTIDVFAKRGDIVNPNRIFITSYDFMNDTGGSCASIWDTLSTPVFMGKGIEKQGTYTDASEIIDELLNESNNIVAIFQHADHSGFDIEKLHDFVTSNIIANSPADLNGSIVYSMSCHAGLNVPEDEKFNYDLAQAFMSKGVLAYVAPTGWGIGGVVTEAGHERLLHYFTTHLCEGMDAGTALMHAKQDYYAFAFDFDYIDQKVASTAVLYGLPMYGVNVEAKTEGLMETMSMEKPCNTFTLRPDYSEIETPVGAYSSVDETLSSPGKPVLPKLIWPYIMDGKMLHGITLKNARYELLENTALPYEEYVVSIAGGYKQPLVTGETWNPSDFFKVSTIGKRQYIILITGQFKKTGWTIEEGQKVNIGDLRRYTELTFDLHLSAPAEEKNPPEITVRYVNSSGITVNATDESGVQKLVMAYTDKKGIWESFDIVPDAAACTLEEEIELEAGKEYFVQVVDIFGNVAVDDNGGRYYLEKCGGFGR